MGGARGDVVRNVRCAIFVSRVSLFVLSLLSLYAVVSAPTCDLSALSKHSNDSVLCLAFVSVPSVIACLHTVMCPSISISAVMRCRGTPTARPLAPTTSRHTPLLSFTFFECIYIVRAWTF